MPSYMIILAKIHDRTHFLHNYVQATAPLVAAYGGRYVMRSPGAHCLEGSFGDDVSVAISEWPNREAIDAFWNSPEYQQAKTLRKDIADCQIYVIDAPKFTLD